MSAVQLPVPCLVRVRTGSLQVGSSICCATLALQKHHESQIATALCLHQTQCLFGLMYHAVRFRMGLLLSARVSSLRGRVGRIGKSSGQALSRA